MFIFPGRTPNPKHDSRRGVKLPFQVFGLVAGLLLNFGVAAEQVLPLTLQESEEIALYDEPGQNAYREHAMALREESVAGGQLPDPKMRIGMANFPIQSGGFSTEGMTQAQLAIRQEFPAGDMRELTTSKYESLANEMTYKADGRGRDVLTAVRISWLETHYWREARAESLASRPFFEDLVTITRSLYAVGRNTQQDVLRAELELHRLDDRIIDMDGQHAAARARLSEWVGTDAERPVGLKLPEWTSAPPLEVLRDNLQAHPALLAADAGIGASVTAVELAEQEKKSGWALDLGYGYREGYLSNGEPRSDFVSLSVSFDLPFFQRDGHDRSVASALGERRAAGQSREKVLRNLTSQLSAEYMRWLEFGRRLELYEQQILSISADNSAAALAAYQSDASDFADVMRAYVDDLNTRLEYMRLKVERAKSFAVLANLGGLPR
jgi:outer membrane protein TolC